METSARPNMLPFFLILLVAISLGAIGQVLLKSGLRQLPEDASAATILLSVFCNARVFMGFFCYGLSSLVYLLALKRLPLSYAYPMVALSYVLVVLISWKVFDEAIPPLRIAALAIILTGVVVLALSYDHNGSETPTAPTTAQASSTSLPGSGTP